MRRVGKVRKGLRAGEIRQGRQVCMEEDEEKAWAWARAWLGGRLGLDSWTLGGQRSQMQWRDGASRGQLWRQQGECTA